MKNTALNQRLTKNEYKNSSLAIIKLKDRVKMSHVIYVSGFFLSVLFLVYQMTKISSPSQPIVLAAYPFKCETDDSGGSPICVKRRLNGKFVKDFDGVCPENPARNNCP